MTRMDLTQRATANAQERSGTGAGVNARRDDSQRSIKTSAVAVMKAPTQVVWQGTNRMRHHHS